MCFFLGSLHLTRDLCKTWGILLSTRDVCKNFALRGFCITNLYCFAEFLLKSIIHHTRKRLEEVSGSSSQPGVKRRLNNDRRNIYVFICLSKLTVVHWLIGGLGNSEKTPFFRSTNSNWTWFSLKRRPGIHFRSDPLGMARFYPSFSRGIPPRNAFQSSHGHAIVKSNITISW